MSYGFQIKKQQSGTPGIFWQRENDKKTDRKFGYKSRDQRFKIRKDPQSLDDEGEYRDVLGPRIDDEEEKKPPKPQKDFIKKNRDIIAGKNKAGKKPPTEKTLGTKGADPKSVTITQDQLNSILASMTKIAGGKEDNLRISIDGKNKEILIDSPRRNHSDDERDHDDDYRYDTDDEKRHKQRNKKQTESKPKRKNKKEEDVSIFDLLNNTSRKTKESSRNNEERKETKKKSHDDSDYDDRRSVEYDHKHSRDREHKHSRDKQKSKDHNRDYSEDRSDRHRSRDRRSRERSRDRKYSRERSRGHHRDRDSDDRDYHRSKSRERESSYDRHRHRYRSHSREDRHRDRYRSHSRDRDDRHRSRDQHRSRDRYRSESRDRDGSGDRDRPRRKRREKEKDREKDEKDEDTSKLTVENHDGDGEKKLTPRDVAGIPLALPWKHMTKAEQLRLLAARNKLQSDEEKAEEKELKEKKKESRRVDSSRRTSRRKNRSHEREPSEISGYGDRDSDNDDRYNRKEDKKKSDGLPPAVPKGHLTLAEKKKEQWARERAESKINEVAYTPWGKPGAGAPIRTDSGKVAADYKSRQVLRYFNLPRM